MPQKETLPSHLIEVKIDDEIFQRRSKYSGILTDISKFPNRWFVLKTMTVKTNDALPYMTKRQLLHTYGKHGFEFMVYTHPQKKKGVAVRSVVARYNPQKRSK
jgi:hypothetical protein